MCKIVFPPTVCLFKVALGEAAGAIGYYIFTAALGISPLTVFSPITVVGSGGRKMKMPQLVSLFP